MRMQQPRNLHRHFVAAARRARNQRCLRHVVGHGDAHAAQRLDPLRDGVHEFALLIEVLVEEKMELVERRPADLPVVFLVQVPQRHGVGQELVEIAGAGGADRGVERDG